VRPDPTVDVLSLRAESSGGVHRVCAEVAGHGVWFESRDRVLAPRAEAFGCAAWLPALFAGVGLRLDGEVCPEWYARARDVAALARRWWGLRPRALEVRVRESPSEPCSPATALCFTGGLDSFHSLLRGAHRPDLLVFVHGYDIPLEDEPRLRAVVPSLERVAAACGARPVVVRTNLRRHPLWASASWEWTHGGALAAVGHLLDRHAARLVIASSIPREYDAAWGSHWRLDPLWSSGAMTVVHDGADFSRHDKAWALAGETLLHDHLRVCWENRTATGNCSTCDKCVNAMLLLHQAGELDRYGAFERPDSFVPLLDALPRTTFVRVYGAMRDRGLPADLDAAVTRLLERTARQAARTARKKRFRAIRDRLLLRRRRRP